MKNYRFVLALLFTLGITSAYATDHDCDQCRGAIGASIHGSTGKWLDQNVPHRNWQCYEVEDLGQPSQDCEMCEREVVRYVHRMNHANHPSLNVGCICAGHMEGNLEAAKSRDKELRSRTQRRANWLALKWKTSKNGNPYIKTRANNLDNNPHHVVITKSGQRYSASIDKSYINKWYNTLDEARLAAFDQLWPSKLAQ
ncbi:MAG: hypothetical protein BGO77_08305 [Caedibacter sp. 37-49]|nr:MAG: hypothetical protein BGO77_08305 [Caedibacter sp. 37-49]